MGCGVIQRTLVAYHFGTADAAARAATDAHLLACGACLAAFLEIKRHAEDAGDEEPSGALYALLRADVTAAVRRSPLERARLWLKGPVPRYHFASAAALLMILAALVARVSAPAPEPPVSLRLDTSRTAGSRSGAY
jgi:hypothetical protein